MGRKVNPNILKTSNKINRHSLHWSKNKEECSTSLFQDVKLYEFINKFFKNYGILLHSYKIYKSDYFLKIKISYYTSLTSLNFVKKFKLKKIKKIPYHRMKYFSYKRFKTFRLDFISRVKIERFKKVWKYKKDLTIYNSFIKSFINGINMFTGNKLKLTLFFQNINKGLSNRFKNHEMILLKRIIFNLRFFKRGTFFRDCFNVILICLKKKNSAKLLCDFIIQILNNSKRYGYFFSFLKKCITALIKKKLFNFKGIRILINGRVKGRSRARPISTDIGNLCIQSFNSDLSYHYSTAFTDNGTLGVKVWIN